MRPPLPVLINRTGGAARALGDGLAAAVEAAFGPTGRAIDLELLDPEQITEAVARHRGQPVITVGGGDGTLGAAAALVANTRSALAVLPLGTRNHLARQLGVPLDLADAARVAVDGQRRRIDLGAAGDRVFVNNASFGLYTSFVRERQRGEHGPGAWRRWRSTARAAWHVLRNVRAQYFSIRADGHASAIATPLLFIGNNEYRLDGGYLGRGHFGERESLAEHQLSLCAIAAKRPLEMVGLALRALLGATRPSRDFLEYGRAREIVLEGSGAIEGAFDGELATVTLPLRLTAMPGALGIVTPRESAQPERTLSRAL